MLDRKEKWFNRTFAEWMSDIIQEARRDMVSADQIVGALTDDFGFSGEELVLAERMTFERLFISDVRIVQSDDDDLYIPHGATISPQAFADYLVAYIADHEEAATLGGLWFQGSTPGAARGA